MPGENLPGRIESRTDRLGDAQHNPPDEGPPETAQSADDDSFECKNEPDRAGHGAKMVRMPNSTPAIAVNSMAMANAKA